MEDIEESNILSVPFPKKAKKKSGGFQSMNLKPSVFRAIKTKGFNLPTPIQRKVIPLALEGRDIVACSRTGSGKTAAFLIPLINRLEKHSSIVGARALILSPTRELALQTSSMYKQFSKFTDLVSAVVVGGHGFEGQFESLASNPDVIIATPGRLAQVLSETNLSFKTLEYLVFDEADFLFEMGFAEHINAILEKVNPNRQTLLFSATIPQQLSEFSRVKLKDYVFCKLDSEFTLSDDIKLNFLLCRSAEKIPTLLYLIQQIITPEETSIIFVSTKYHVDLLTLILNEFSLPNVGIYGKMDQLTRKENLSLLRSQKVKIMIVTDLAARGLDIPFVNNVIHFDYPPKPKIFIHRSGRTARAGRTGNVFSLIKFEEIMFVSEISLYIGRKLSCEENDFKSREKAIYGKVPTELLSFYMESMDKLKINPNFFKEFDVSEKAYKQFLKTRKKTSKSSLENSKTLNCEAINPIFTPFMGNLNSGDLKKKEEMIHDIKNYKPKTAYLELNKIKKNEDQKANEEFFKIVNRMKKIEQKTHDRNLLKLEKEHENENEPHEEKEELQNIMEETTNKNIRLNKKRMRRLEEKNQSSEPVETKKNKSSFKHPTQYVSAEPPILKQSKMESLENSNKISSEDVNPFLLGENFDDLGKARKKMLWDTKKKKFVTGTMTETGELKKDKEDNKMKKDHGKKMFKTWSKRNMMTFQNEGEMEDSSITRKAKDLFKNRRKRNFFPEGQENPSVGQFDKNKNKPRMNRKGKGAKRELKNPKQMLKARIQKNKMNLKNMDKTKRRQIIHRQKKKF